METVAQYGVATVAVVGAFILLRDILNYLKNGKESNSLRSVINNNTTAINKNTEVTNQLITLISVSSAEQKSMLNELLAHARKK